jgi:multimeric flavodoxin WrbA
MAKRRVVIVYHSQEAGNTAAAAELVAKGVREAGAFEIVMKNTNDGRVDPVILDGCAGAAFGTPDYFSYPAGGLKMFMDDWLLVKRGGNEAVGGMPVALFMTHGGGGNARGPFEDLLRHVGPQVDKTLSIKGRPAGKDADACVALGKELAAAADKHARKAS